jgi:hypothetical protein
MDRFTLYYVLEVKLILARNSRILLSNNGDIFCLVLDFNGNTSNMILLLALV